MSKISTAPQCKYCDKPMTKYTRLMQVDPGCVPSHFDNGGVGGANGRKVLEVTKRVERGLMEKEFIYVWMGDYGYRGNNHFCTMRCGYRYALDLV